MLAFWEIFARRPETASKRSRATAWGNTASASTINGGSVFVWREGDAYDVEIVDYH
jgi:hypothetical protein